MHLSQVHQPCSFRGCTCLKCTNHVVFMGCTCLKLGFATCQSKKCISRVEVHHYLGWCTWDKCTPLQVPLQVPLPCKCPSTNEKSRTSISKFCSFLFLLLLVEANSVIKHVLHRPTQTSAPTDADIRIDRRRHPHRPTQTSAPTDADIRTDRRRHPHRPTQMLQVAMCFCQSSLQFCSSYPSNGSFLFSAF